MALTPRPPIITILGHVDHGKTTLLDYIRKTNVQAKEAGGITQHIGAYQIEHEGKPITFIDTPGHAAFNKMRERGAGITDIVILVVAANDGVKPQTIESIRYIRESKASFLIAINKMDIKDVKTDNVKAQLAEHEVIVQDFGGDVEVIEISAKTGKGVDKLLETIALMAELMELKADAKASLEAVVIESAKDPHKGPIARVIVQQGTLSTRQNIEIETENEKLIEGRVKLLTDYTGKSLKEVLPGSPAEIVGLKDIPEVGLIVREKGAEYAVTKEIASENVEGSEEAEPSVTDEDVTGEEADPYAGWADLDLDLAFGDKIKLNLIVKADVKGTLEAIMQNIDEDSVTVISSGVGPLTEQEIELADTSKALVVAFNIKVARNIKNFARDMKVKVKEYDIIYHLIEDLQKMQLKIMEPTIDEVVTGEAEVLQIFEMKGETIAGVKVKTGELKKNDLFHLKRGDEILSNPVLKSMKHGKEDVLAIKTKNEGGLTFKNKKLDFQVGDIIVAYKVEE